MTDLDVVRHHFEAINKDPDDLGALWTVAGDATLLVREVEKLRALRPETTAAVLTHMNRADAAEAEIQNLRQALADGEASDGHHTHNELYAYRLAYNAALFNEWAASGKYNVVKSWKHSDDEPCFGGGWFIVVAELPTGQISNHYQSEHWDAFNVPAVDLPPEYDGHTPSEALARLQTLEVEPSAAEAAIARVRELHQPRPDDYPGAVRYCSDCLRADEGNPDIEWPCATIRTLDGEVSNE